MGDTGPIETTRFLGEQNLANILSNIIGQPQTFQDLATRLSLPQFQGPFAAPITPVQEQALGGVQDLLETAGGQFGQSQDVINQIGQLAQGGPLAGTAGGTSPIAQQLLGFGAGGAAGAERAALGGLGPARGVLPAQALLGGLATGGAQQSLLPTFAAIDAQRRAGLGRDIRDIRELFSAQGNRFSTDLANTVAARQAESEAGQLAEFGRLSAGVLPAQLQAQLGAATGLGQLGLGQQQQGIQALLGGGQLGLGGAQLGAQAAGTLGSLQNQAALGQLGALAGIPGLINQNIAAQLGLQRGAFGLGEGARRIEDMDILRRMAEFQRTSGAGLPGITGFFGAAPQIVQPGIGDQLFGLGAGLGGAALLGPVSAGK